MSETVNTAEIRVVADASGVEAGLRPAIDAAQRAERAISGIGTGSARSQQNLIQAIQRTTAEMEAGSRTGARYFEVMAQQRGIDPGVLQPYLQQLRAVEQAQQGAGQSAGQTANALRQVPAQLTDVITSLQGGMEPLTVLIQQGGQLRDSFGGIGPAARAMGSQVLAMVNPLTVAAAAVAILTAAYYEGSQEADLYRNSLVMTGNAIGLSVGQVADMAQAIGKVSGTQKGAVEALVAMVDAGNISAERLQRFATVAIDLQEALGVSVADTAQEFSDLGGSPVEAVEKLNEKYHFLTAAVYDQIRALDSQGRTEEAAEVAQDALAKAMEARTKTIVANLGYIESRWKELGEFASKAWDKMLGIGRADTSQDKLNGLLKEQARIEENIASARANKDTYGERKQQILLAQAQSQISAIRGVAEAEKEKAKSDAANQQQEEARIQWNKQADDFLGKRAKREKDRQNEIIKIRNEGAAAGISAEEVEKRIAALRRKHAEEDPKPKKPKRNTELEQEARLLAELSGVTASYVEDLSRLNGAYAKGNLGQERYVELVTELIGKQPGAKKMIDETAKEMADYAKSIASAEDALERELASITKQIQATRDQNEQIGLSKSAMAELEAARLDSIANRLEENSIIAEGLDLTGAKADGMRKEAAALRELAAEKRDGAVRQASSESAQQAAEDWKKTAESIESSLTDALLRGFESGKSFGKNLVDTLKNMFGTLVLRPIISATVNPLAASLTNTLGLGGGAAGASSAAGGFASAASGVSNLYSMVSGGATVAGGLGTGFLGSLAGGLNGAGIGSGLTSALGMNIGNGIASVVGTNVASGIATGLSGLAAAAPWVAGALAVYTIGKKAFGRGPKEYSGDQTLNGSLGAGGFSGTMDSAWVKKGGWFRSDKEGFDKNQVGAEFSAGLTSAYDAIKASSADFADVLGLNAASIASRSQAIKIALGKDEAANQAAIAEFFVGVANTVAAELLPEIGKFQVQGEQASATLQRLAVNFSAVDQILMVMGSTSLAAFGAVGKDSIEARERLVALAGGIEALAEKTTFFNDSFLSQAERVANAQGPLNEKLASLGFAGITTSEQFKDAAQGLVKSGALANEAGAKIYAELLALGPQYKLVSDYLKEASDTAAEAAATLAGNKRGLEIQIMQLLGDKAGALAATRALELAEMDASLRPLRERVYALEDEAAALDTANSLLSIQAQIYELTGDKAGAAAVLSQQHINALAALDPALRGATQNLWDLQAAAKATEQVKTAAAALMSGVDGAFSALQKVVERQKKATQEEIDVRTKAVEKTRSLSEALRSTLDGLTVAGTEKNDRAAAQAQIQAALAIAKASGILPKADDLKNALSVIGKDSTGLFASQEDYLRDFYATKNGITDLAKITDKTLSAEERSLKALEGQVKQYDDMLQREQEQIDVLKGISTIGLSIEQAIQALHGAMGAAGANPYNSATSQISDAYKSSLGRAPDAAGLSYWQDRAAGGISTEAIIGSIKGSPEAQIQALYKDVFGRPADSAGLSYWIDRLKGGISLGSIRDTFEESAEKKLRGFAVGTNYVPADMPAQIHQGERIIPAADNRELMRRLASPGENSAVLVAAVERLTEENRGMRKDLNDALYAIAKNTMNTASSLDDALNGEKPLATKVIA